MQTNKFKRMAIAAAILGLGTVAAQAAPLTVDANGFSCVDQAACDSTSAAGQVGIVTFSVPLGTIAGYDQLVLTANSYPDTGTPGQPVLRLNVDLSTTAGSGNAQMLTLRATQTTFTLSGPSSFDLGSTVNFPSTADGVAPQATLVTTYTLDNNDAAFGTTTPLGSKTFTFTGTNVSAQADNQTVFANADGSFSLTNQLVFNGIDLGRTLAASSVVGANALPVPEPTSMALFGVAMFGLGATRLRRRKQD